MPTSGEKSVEGVIAASDVLAGTSLRGLGLLTLGGLRGVLVREGHGQLEESARPDSLLLAGDTTLPHLQIEDTLRGTRRFREEAEWVILAPLLSVTCQVSDREIERGNGTGGDRDRTSPPGADSGRATSWQYEGFDRRSGPRGSGCRWKYYATLRDT